MAAETQYTSNLGMVTISTANSNLDGSTGTYYDVITAAANGTLIITVTVKAQVSTTQGMVRLFAYNGSTTKLIAEIEVPAITKSSTYPAFETTVVLNYDLVASGKLKASTQNGETFNVIAEGLDWAYYGSVRPESTNYVAGTDYGTIDTANSNLDGTGTIINVITAASSGSGSKGTLIQSILIKAQVSTTAGMIRLFIYDGTNTKLLTEVQVPAITKSGTANSFSARIDFGGRDFALKAGWSLKASTENAERFNVFAEGIHWGYPA